MHGTCIKIMEVSRNVGTKKSDAGASPKRQNTTFIVTRRKFETKDYSDCNTVQSGLRFAVGPRSARNTCSLQTGETATTPKWTAIQCILLVYNSLRSSHDKITAFPTYCIDWDATYTALVKVNLATKAHGGTEVQKCRFSNNTTVFSSSYMLGIGLMMATKQ
jgi:hypothetical protein